MAVLQQSTSRVEQRRTIPISSHVMPGIVVLLDSLAILLAALVSYVFIIGDALDNQENYVVAVCAFWIVILLLMNFGGLYQFDVILRPFAFADKILLAFAVTILFLLAAAFSVKISVAFSRVWVGSFTIGACATTLIFRFAAARVLKRLADLRMFTRNIVIAGAGEQAEHLLTHLGQSRMRYVAVLGVFSNTSTSPKSNVVRYPVLGEFDDISDYVRSNSVDDVIIALPWSAHDQIAAIVDKLRELPVNIYLGSDLIGFRMPFRKPPEHFGDLPMVEVMGKPLAGWGKLSKASLDYCFGVVLFLLALPLMAMIAIAIKIDSDGPVLFQQPRYGFVNQIFMIYKFRTMTYEEDGRGRTIQATRNDPRVTRIGRVLRRMSLDELPQLFNVLNGTMSIVGPRPHAIDHNEDYSKMIRGYFARHRVKPGITGWAQVNGLRGEVKSIEQIEARVRHDIYYAENWTLFFDLKILVMTAVVCLTGRNAY